MFRCRLPCVRVQYRCVILVASFLAHMIEFGIVWTVGLFNLLFLEAFDRKSGETALISSINTASFYAAGPLSGALVNKFGHRPTCIVGGLIGTTGLILSGLAPNIYFLYFTFGFLTGFGLGIAYVPSLSIVGLYYNKRQTLAFAVATAGVGLGVVIFPFLIQLFTEHYSWRGATLITGGICLNLCVLGALLREPTTHSDTDMRLTPGPPRSTTRRATNEKVFNLQVFKNVPYLLFCFHNTLYWFGHSVVCIHMPTYGASLGLSTGNVSLLISITGITGFLCKFPVGLLSLCKQASPMRMYIIGVTACAVATLLVPLATGLFGLAIYAAIFGMLLALLCGNLPSVVVNILDVSLLPSGFGYMLFFEAFGSLLGAPAAGWIYDKVQNYDPSFYLAGVAMLLSAVVMIGPCRLAKTSTLPTTEKNNEAPPA